jgi:uncharacterized short protein YbdD (DUF466 family)
MPRRALQSLRNLFVVCRSAVAQDAYCRYVAHHLASHPREPPLNRRDFYLREQQRKWSGISRCC